MGISTYASYGGLSPSLDKLAYLGAGLIGIVLFASDLTISTVKRTRRGTIWPALIAFSFALLFSTASNFNYFYSSYFEREVSRDSYISAVSQFEENVRSAQRRLAEDPAIRDIEELQQEVQSELDELERQVLDPEREGVGSRAHIIMSKIDSLIEVADIAVPRIGSPRSRLQEFLKTYREAAEARLQFLTPPELQRYADLRRKMQVQLAGFRDLIVEFQGARAVSSEAVTQIENMASATKQYEAEINAILSAAPRWRAPNTLDPDVAEIGNIVETFKNAFSVQGDVGVAILSLLLSAFIDFIPLIYALTLVREVKRRESEDFL